LDNNVWKPHTTVASICERDGKYLLVRESANGRIVYNQPYPFTPQSLQGVYRFRPNPEKDKTYLRFLFRGNVGEQVEGELDQGIIAAEWLSYDEVLACRAQHRSPMVLQCIEDFRDGPGYPLDIFSKVFA
jgi:hypothetical protein